MAIMANKKERVKDNTPVFRPEKVAAHSGKLAKLVIPRMPVAGVGDLINELVAAAEKAQGKEARVVKGVLTLY